MGIRRVTSSSPCLISVTRVKRSLLKSASKFMSILNRMGMKLQSKPGSCMSVKTELFKRFQSVGEVVVLLLGGLQLILGPGVFTVFDLHEMDVPLFWEELTRVAGLGGRWSGCGWR
eukprot:1141960-Pelagomonas_calceolata.AAC.5